MIEIVEIKDHPTNKTTSYNPFIIDLWIRLLSFHSPLLRKSNFVYIPLPSNMFKFGRFSYMKLSTTHEWKFGYVISFPILPENSIDHLHRKVFRFIVT